MKRRFAAVRLVAGGLFVAFLLAVPSRATAEWLRVDTARFCIVFEPEDAATAAEVLALSDSVHRRVTEYLAYVPKERIPVVIYGDTSAANGFFSPFPPHIALYVASPTGPWLGARTESWIEALFIHELTHYVHLTRPIGFFGTLSSILGPLTTSASTLFLPGWAIEGPTVNGETILTGGGRGRNAFFEMGWVAPILEDEFYTYDQAGASSSFPPSGRIYSAGYLMVNHLYDRYGPETFVELNREFQRLPFLGMRRAFRRTTGTSVTEFFDDMTTTLEEDYRSRVSLPTGAPLSPEEAIGVWQFVSAGEHGVYAYVRTQREAGALYHIAWDGSLPERLVGLSPLDDDSIGVSRDGRRAVAAIEAIDYAGAGATTGYSDLTLIDLENGRTRRLTTHRRFYHPRIDPTGRIYAIERVGSYSRLVEIDSTDGTVTERYAPTARTHYQPTISADGTLLALVENDHGRQDIIVLETEGFTPVAIVGAPDEGAEYYPQFVTVDEHEELWFSSDRDGRLALYRTRRDAIEAAAGDLGSIPRIADTRLLEDQVGAFIGAPTPDGTVIYGSYRSNGYGIRVGTPLSGGDPGVPPTPQEGTLPPPTGTDPLAQVPHDPTDGNAASTDAVAALESARPYRDLPRPVLWLPLASLTTGSDEETVWQFGAAAIAVSALNRHQATIIAYYEPVNERVSGELAYTFTPGATSFDVGITQEYNTDNEIERSAALSVTRPLWVQRRLLAYRGLVASLGGLYRATGDAPSEEVAALGSFRLFSTRFGAARDAFGGPGAEIGASIALLPPYLDTESFDVESLGEIEIQRRVAPNSAVQVRSTIAVAGDTRSEALDILPYRAGRFDPDGDDALASASGAALGRLELLLPLGLYDGAWRGGSIHRLGTAFYLEQEAALTAATHIDGTDADLEPGNFTVPGLELVADLAFNAIPFRVRAGLAVRVPHGEEGGSNEMTVYFRVDNIGGLDTGNRRRFEDFF